MSIQTYVEDLEHASQCRDGNCRRPSCKRMKHLISHLMSNKHKNNAAAAAACMMCKQLRQLCLHHAKSCKLNKCLVPMCPTIKARLEQQRIEQQVKDQMLMRRRMAQMHQMRNLLRGVRVEKYRRRYKKWS